MDEREPGITILEAVETLASIADLSEEENLKLRNTLRLEGKRLGERKIDWLKTHGGKAELDLLVKSLNTVHQYFRTLWREQDPSLLPRDVREGVRTIWGLISQALDTISSTPSILTEFAGSARNLPAYQELYNFYTRKIDPKIDEAHLGRWVLGLAQLPFSSLEQPELLLKRKISLSPGHLIVDLESLKSDQDYELLFIKKADGTRFYNPRLIRNLKLIGEVGFQEKGDDLLPLYSPWKWIDRQCEAGAKLLLESTNRLIEPFLKERGKFKERDLSRNISHGIVALLLAEHPRYLSDNSPAKSTSDFFRDVINFLRDAVTSHDFRRLLTYPTTSANRLGKLLESLPQSLCYSLYTEIPTFKYEGIVRFLQGGKHTERNGSLTEGFKIGYQWLEEGVKGYGNSPLKRDLEDIEEGASAFDPILQPILPAKIGEMRFEEKAVSLHRFASPVHQEQIDKAAFDPLFIAALREMKARGETVLIFNLQERSHWKERARAEMLENLSQRSDWSETLQVVTLDVASEFFLQELQFEKGDKTEVFVESYRQFLLDERGGNFFSSKVEEILFPGFIEKAFQEMHKQYFASRNVLTPELKRRFIDLMTQFIQLKVVDALKPDRVIFLDKDGAEASSVASTLFFMTPKLFSNQPFTLHDLETYEALLYSSTLLYRERAIRKGKFERFVDFVGFVDEASQGSGFWTNFTPSFSALFPNGSLKAGFIPF